MISFNIEESTYINRGRISIFNHDSRERMVQELGGNEGYYYLGRESREEGVPKVAQREGEVFVEKISESFKYWDLEF